MPGPSPSLSVWRILGSPLARAWALSAVLLSMAGFLWWVAVWGRGPLSSDVTVPWWALLVAVFAAESMVIHLHFRSESGTFSLLEIPLVFGLVFAEPGPGVVAMVAGALLSLRLVRRQPLLKLVFNVANLSLNFTLAYALLHLFLFGRDPLTPLGWFVMLGVTSLVSVANFTTIVLVIAITERHLDISQSLNALLFAILVAAANTIQALIAALVIVTEPWAVFLLTCSAGILYIAYRAYVTEREQREKVEFLYASTRALREGGQSGSAVADFLAETASMFRAETVMLYLFPAPDSGVAPALFTQRDATFQADAITGQEEAEAEALATAAPSPLLVVEKGAGPETVTEWLAANGVKRAMVGALPSEDRLVGVLVVGDRLGNVTTFTETDLRLFTTLVEHASVALEKDQLGQALIQLRELGQELERQAKYDELTGLANRTMFTSRLDDLYASAGNDGCVLYVDLDDFKPVNDTHGHAAGDALLAQVATRIEAATRPDDLAARLGGDEFAVLLPSGADGEVVAQRLIGALSAPFQIVADEVRIGASVGIAHRKNAASASQLVLHADTALYAAKEEGKGTVVVYGDHLRTNMPRRHTVQSDLRRAIDQDEFEIHYQPIVRLDDLSIVGAEALVRWRQPSGRLVQPAEFINEAEQSGLITSVDRLVRVEVLDRLELFQEMDPQFFISVNLSARHLRRSDLVDEISSDLTASAVPVDGLIFELTESALAGDAEAAARRLGEIRALGPRIALDDFGTGYSSLSYLRTLPVDLIKIAQPFIQDMSNGDTTFVSAIIGLSQKLGFTTVAEGIEQEWPVEILQGMGCDLGQGFHFACPMELDELTELIGRDRRTGRLPV